MTLIRLIASLRHNLTATRREYRTGRSGPSKEVLLFPSGVPGRELMPVECSAGIVLAE
jgi:hypothetical protein